MRSVDLKVPVLGRRRPRWHGTWSLHRRLRHGRRDGAPGSDRERPRQRLDAGLQGRPRLAADASATCCCRTRQTGQTVGPLGQGAAHREAGHRPAPAGRCARPASRSTSRSPGDGFFAVQTAAGRALHAQRLSSPPPPTATSSTSSATRSWARTASRVTVDADGTIDRGEASASSPSPTLGKQGDNLLHRHRRRPRHGRGQLRRARGLGRRPDARDGRHDRLAARLRGRRRRRSRRSTRRCSRPPRRSANLPRLSTVDRSGLKPWRERPTTRRTTRCIGWTACAEAAPNYRSRPRCWKACTPPPPACRRSRAALDSVANDLANVEHDRLQDTRVAFRDLLHGGSDASRRPRCASARAPRRPSSAAASPRAPCSRPTTRSTSRSRARASSRSSAPTAPSALTRDGNLQIDAARPPRHPARRSWSSRRSPSPRAPTEDQVTIAADGTVSVNGKPARPDHARQRRPPGRPRRRRRQPLPGDRRQRRPPRAPARPP